MKIGETSNQVPDFPREPRRVKGKGGAPVSGGIGAKKTEEVAFSQAFLDAADTQTRKGLEELMRLLDEQGERLAKSQTFDELEKYQKVVRNFIEQATRRIYSLRASDGGLPSAKKKVYVILQKVDAEMEALTKAILARQVPQLRLLERLGQIKGLLLDLYK